MILRIFAGLLVTVFLAGSTGAEGKAGPPPGRGGGHGKVGEHPKGGAPKKPHHEAGKKGKGPERKGPGEGEKAGPPPPPDTDGKDGG